MDSILRDLVLAARLLRRRAGFSALAITILAIAIGANSAIFSVVNAVLLRAPAFEEPERLVAVWERRISSPVDRNVVSAYNYTRWRERARSFTDLAAFSARALSLSGSGDPERLAAGATTGNLFAVLGVKAHAGRTLVDDDSRAGAPSVAVLSEGLWRRRFGGDPGIVGRSITPGWTSGHRGRRDAGVVPVSRRHRRLDPLMDDALRTARGRGLLVVGRLEPEATLAQAREEMKGLAADLVRENPDFNTDWSATVFPLHADLVRDVRPALVVLIGAVTLLLLVGCANVANLLLARAVSRAREVAIRSALGAGPGRLVRQLLTESVLLAALGGAAGLLLAAWVMKGLVAMLPEEIRLTTQVGLDPTVVAFTAGLSLASAIVFGLIPALHQARPALVPSLKEGGATRGASGGARRLKNALVVAEVALSLVLTAGTGLLLRSFWNLAHVDAGFRPQGVLTVPVNLPDGTYGEPERQTAFMRDAVARLAHIPGAVSAGAISVLPMSRGGSATRFYVMDRPVPARGEEPRGDIRIVTPGLLATMGLPLLAGRDFSDRDTAGRPTALIVNRSVAQQFWPGQDPIGKRIRMSWEGDPQGRGGRRRRRRPVDGVRPGPAPHPVLGARAGPRSVHDPDGSDGGTTGRAGPLRAPGAGRARPRAAAGCDASARGRPGRLAGAPAVPAPPARRVRGSGAAPGRGGDLRRHVVLRARARARGGRAPGHRRQPRADRPAWSCARGCSSEWWASASA